MDCREMDHYFVANEMPPEATAHLAACAECRRVRALVDQEFESDAIGEELEKQILARILRPLEPVRPLPKTPWFAAVAVVSLVAVAIAGAAMMGVGGARSMTGFQIAAVVLPMLGCAVIAAFSLRRQMAPASRQEPPAVLMAAALGTVAGPAALLFSWHRTAAFLSQGLQCWAAGLMFAIPAVGLLLVLVRRGVFVDPARAGLTVGLLAGLCGAGGLALACPVLEAAHLCLFHSGILVASSGIGTLAMQAFLRARRDRAPKRA